MSSQSSLLSVHASSHSTLHIKHRRATRLCLCEALASAAEDLESAGGRYSQ